MTWTLGGDGVAHVGGHVEGADLRTARVVELGMRREETLEGILFVEGTLSPVLARAVRLSCRRPLCDVHGYG